MGGKQKQAQRTKNNTRPSSSGRSAELLENSTGKIFSALRENANFIAVATSVNVDDSIEQDFQLTVKKMNKKDPVTRQKALLEFADLCNTRDSAAVKAVLPFWPRLYNTLAVDVDHRVREATQQAHKAIISRVKRDIAPHLKQLIGTWLVSSFDSNLIAANLAKASFQAAFSSTKRTEAIIFARREILHHIVQSIINTTPESLVDPKNCPVEESHAKYQQIVSSNLLGYSQYLETLPSEYLNEAKDENKQLLLNTAKFWKFPKEGTKSVKVAWFMAILVLIDKAPSFLEDSHKKLCLSVFTNLDCDDCNLLPLVWEIALHSCDIIPNLWEHVSAEKLVLPKLSKVFKEAAFGNASVVYPLILPLLSKLQLLESEKSEDICSKLLTDLVCGINTSKVRKSASETEVVVSTVFDCFSHILKLNESKSESCISCVMNHLVPLVENSLNDKRMYGTSSTVFKYASSLLRFWYEIRSTSSVYQSVIDAFWSAVGKIVLSPIGTETEVSDTITNCGDLEERLKIHLKFVNSLKNPTDIRMKKQAKVRFALDEECNDNDRPENTPKNDDRFIAKLHQIVDDLISVYYNETSSFKHSYLFVNQLCNILNLFSDKRYYERLTVIITESPPNNASQNSSQLIDDVIRRWLGHDNVSVDAVLNVVFHLLLYLKDEEKVNILNNISEDHMSSMLDLCLNLAGDSQLQSSVHKWLSSSYFKTTLTTFAHEVSRVWPPSMEKANILRACFKVPKNEESYTDDDTKSEILKVFRDALLLDNANTTHQPPHKDNLTCIASVLKEIFNEYNYPLLRKNQAVITTTIGYLFLFGCNAEKNYNKDDVLNEAWVLGVKTLAKIFGCTSPDFINVTERFAVAVVELIEKCKCKIEDVKLIIDFVCTYIECLPMDAEVGANSQKDEERRHKYEDAELDSTSTVYADTTSFICEVFLKIAVQYCHANMENSVVNACLKAEYYSGTLSYKLPASSTATTSKENVPHDADKVDDVNECFAAVPKLYNVAYYIVAVIDNYLCVESKYETSEEDGGQSTAQKTIEEPFLSKHALGKLNESVVYVVYLLSVLKSFVKHFEHAKYYDQITDSNLTELQSITSKIVKKHPRSPILLLKLAIMNKAFQCGNFWAEALFVLFTELMEERDMNEVYQEILKCHEVSDHRNKSYISHVSELFAAVVQCRVELYSPDAKLDEEKLSILTLHLRANKEPKYSSDQDRVIWYWLDTILIHKKQLESTFNKNLVECKPSDIVLAATVCRFLSLVSDGKIPLMTDKRTDFMMIALASWMQSIHKTCSSCSCEDNSQYSMAICVFISAVCDMFKSMTKLASNVTYSDKLFIEWNNVFAAETHTIISYNWKSIAEKENCRSVEQFLILNTLSELVITHVDFKQFVVRPDMNFWLCACSDLIQSYCTSVRLAAYYILSELSMEMVNHDSCNSVVDDMKETLTLETLSISSLQTIVNIVLSSYRNGDNRILDSNSDSFVYVHSYLLVWMVVTKMCENASAQLRYRYALWLKEEGYMEIFFHNLLLLMPDKVHKNNLSDNAVKKMREWFSNEPKFTLEDRWDMPKLSILVCRLYYTCLWLLPAFVRQWWKGLEHKDSILVDKLTTRFVSSSLIMEEMKAIKREKPADKFSLKGYPATRQIVASYTVEDTTMEIIMQLAPNHPLGVVKVDSSKVVILSSKWRTWAKQLNMYLAHQNGSIRDGIMSWKSNVDKAFEGVEECYICFSIVHSSNYDLPKRSCKTCHKKFHSLCLFKWFITSNKSSCPICRNHF